MHKVAKKSMILFLVASIVVVSFGAPALAEETYEQQDIDAGAMAVDCVFVRPFGFLATIVGSTLFVVALPFAAIGGNADAAYDKMVLAPARFTFMRPLGAF